MKRFARSVPGRLLTAALAVPLLAGGLAPWSPEGTGLLWNVTAITLSILLAIVGIGMAVEEFPSQAIAAVIALPPGLFVLVLGSGVVVRSTATVGYAMAGAGAFLLVSLVRASVPEPSTGAPRVASGGSA